MTAHNFEMTLLATACFYVSFALGGFSLQASYIAIIFRDYLILVLLRDEFKRSYRLGLASLSGLGILLFTFAWMATRYGPFEHFTPVPANLIRARLTEMPSDWRNDRAWMADYRVTYMRANGLPLGEKMPYRQETIFLIDARDRRRSHLQSLEAVNLDERDLRNGYLHLVFAPGATFRQARLDGAQFRGAQLEGADFFEAEMNRTDLRKARLQNAILAGASLRDANLSEALLKAAHLQGSQMQGALLENADLRSADLFSAKLYDARVAGWKIKAASLRSVDLSLVLGVTQASVNTAFGDAGTILPIGLERPCHWSSDKPQRPMPLEDDLEYWQWLLRGGPPECADDASD